MQSFRSLVSLGKLKDMEVEPCQFSTVGKYRGIHIMSHLDLGMGQQIKPVTAIARPPPYLSTEVTPRTSNKLPW